MYIYVNNYKIGIPDEMVRTALQPSSNLALIPETVTQREARAMLFQVNAIINKLAIELDKRDVEVHQESITRLVENVLNEFRSEFLNLDRVLRPHAPFNFYRVLKGEDARNYKANGGYFHIIVEDEFRDFRYVILFHNRAIKRLNGTAVSLQGYTCRRSLIQPSKQILYGDVNIESIVDRFTKLQVSSEVDAPAESDGDDRIDEAIDNSEQGESTVTFHSNFNDDELCYEVTLNLADAPLPLSSVNGEFLTLDIELDMANCSSFSLAKLNEIDSCSYEVIQDTTTVKNLGEVNFIHFNDVFAQLIEHAIIFEQRAPQLEFSSANRLALNDIKNHITQGLAIDNLTSSLTTINELTDEVSALSQIDNVELLHVLKKGSQGLLISYDQALEKTGTVNILGTYLDDLSYYRDYGEFIASLTQLQWNIPFIVGTLFKNNTLDKAIGKDISTVENELAIFANYDPLTAEELEKLNILIDMLSSTQVKLTNTLIAQHLDASQAETLDKIINALRAIDYRTPVYKTPLIFDGTSLTGGCHVCELDPDGSGDVAILYNDGLSVLLPTLQKRRGTFTVLVESSADCTGAKNSEIQHFTRDYFLLGDFGNALSTLYLTHYGEESAALEELRVTQVVELDSIKQEISLLLEKHRNYQHALKQITHLNIMLDKLYEYQKYFTLGLDKDLDVLPFRLLADLPYAAYDQTEVATRQLKPDVRSRIKEIMSVLSNIDFNFGTYNSANVHEFVENTLVGKRISLTEDELPFNTSCKVGYSGPGFTGQLTSETAMVTLSKGFNSAETGTFPVKKVMESWREVQPAGYDAMIALARDVQPDPLPFRINWNLLILPSLEARAIDSIIKSVFSASLLNSRDTEKLIRTELYGTSLFRQLSERIVAEFDSHIAELSQNAAKMSGLHKIQVTTAKGDMWTAANFSSTYKMGNMFINQGIGFFPIGNHGGIYLWNKKLENNQVNINQLNHVIRDHSLKTVYFVDYPRSAINQTSTYRTKAEVPTIEYNDYETYEIEYAESQPVGMATGRKVIKRTYGIGQTDVVCVYLAASHTTFKSLKTGATKTVSGEVILDLSEDPMHPNYFLGGVGTCDSTPPIIDHQFAGDEHWPPTQGSASCKLEIPVNFTFSETQARRFVAEFNELKENNLYEAFERFLSNTGLGSEWRRFENIFVSAITQGLTEYRSKLEQIYSNIDDNLISIIVPDIDDPTMLREIHIKDAFDDEEKFAKEQSKTWYIQEANRLHPDVDNYNGIYDLYTDAIGKIKYEPLTVDGENGLRKILLYHDATFDLRFYINLLKSHVQYNDLTSSNFDELSLERSKDFLPTNNYVISYTIGTSNNENLFLDDGDDINPDDFNVATTLGVFTVRDLVAGKIIKPNELREIICYKKGVVEDLSNAVRGIFSGASDIVGYLNDESEMMQNASGRVGFPYSPASFLANVVTSMRPRSYSVDKLCEELGYKTLTKADKLLTDPGLIYDSHLELEDNEKLILMDIASESNLVVTTANITTKLFPNDGYIRTTLEDVRKQLKTFAAISNNFPRLTLVNRGLQHLEVVRSQENVFDSLYVIQRVDAGEVNYKFMFTPDQIIFLEALSLLQDCNKGGIRTYRHNSLYSVMLTPKLAGYVVVDKSPYLADVMRG